MAWDLNATGDVVAIYCRFVRCFYLFLVSLLSIMRMQLDKLVSVTGWFLRSGLRNPLCVHAVSPFAHAWCSGCRGTVAARPTLGWRPRLPLRDFVANVVYRISHVAKVGLLSRLIDIDCSRTHAIHTSSVLSGFPWRHVYYAYPGSILRGFP